MPESMPPGTTFLEPGHAALDDRPSEGPDTSGLERWLTDDEDDYQKLMDEVDAGFFAATSGGGRDSLDATPEISLSASRTSSVPTTQEQVVDMAAALELFELIAAEHARPIRDFMIEMTWGETPKTWIAVCRPAARMLRSAAYQMDLGELRDALDTFLTALELAEDTAGRIVSPDAREMLVEAFAALPRVMPKVFALEEERSRREPIIVHSLLLQVREVGKVSLDKIYAAGLMRLDMFYAAKPPDIAAATGLGFELCRRICERFQAYRAEVENTEPDEQRRAEHNKLESEVSELRRLNNEYAAAAKDWSVGGAAEKRRISNDRNRVFLEIKVVLARLGQVDRIQTLEKLSFDLKVRDLEKFLEEARNTPPSPTS
jgi:hypothetical protein